MRARTVLERLIVAAALCSLAAAVGVGVLTAPWFTRVVVARLDIASATGLTSDRAAATAEHVRLFVTDRDAPPLPGEVDGRSGFDGAAAAHLVDVREVLIAARTAAVLLALALVVWFGLSLRRRRWVAIGAALRWGGLACLLVPLVLVTAGAVDFERLFTAFHGVFFDPGTWVFPSDSLLILLFPEPFWVVSGASLAVLVAVQGAVLWLLGRGVGARVE